MCCTSPCGENDIYYLLRATGALAVFHLTIVTHTSCHITGFSLGLEKVRVLFIFKQDTAPTFYSTFQDIVFWFKTRNMNDE